MSKKRKVIIDFETYYDKELSVTTIGVPNYVKKSDAYCVGIIGDDFEFVGGMSDVQQLYDQGLISPDDEPVAANSNFDQAWWEKYFPAFKNDWHCVLDQARFHQYPRALAPIVQVVLKRKMDKSTRDEMKGVRFESLPEARQQQVLDYCLNDCREEKQLLETLGPMSPLEQEVAAHTRLLNRRGIHINVEKIERDITFLEQVRFDALKAIPWAEDAKPLSYQEFCKWVAANNSVPPACMDKRDPGCEKWVKENPKLAPVLESMRLYRGTNTKTVKLKSMMDFADENGKIPLNLLYCGAPHTRRWSSPVINVQNLDSSIAFAEQFKKLKFFQDNPDEVAGIDMRGYYLPPPGKKFGILDYSQIEPRFTHWLVGNEAMLEAMRAGFSVYESYAIACSIWKGNQGTFKHENPVLYKCSKIDVLSLGYGMGWGLYQQRAALPPPVGIGVQYTELESKGRVSDFRRRNPKITGQWRYYDELIESAARDCRSADPKTLEIMLPTGDLLKHFHVSAKGAERGYHSYTVRGDFSEMSHQNRLWGGTLLENVIQRMARDLMAHALLKLEKAGFPLVFHAHDEAVMAFDESSAESDLKDAQQVMSQPPEWCEDLPVAVEGSVHSQYVKLK